MILKKRYTVTAALPYANGPLHIGHMAGAYLPADIFVRYLRARGADVAFICGSDEHGAAITMRAKKEGISPQQIIDRYHQLNKDTFKSFGVSFDIFHRTSEPIHHELAQSFFLELYNKGEFEEKESEQYYDEEFDQFLADRYIVGTCPHCSFDGAYGDQCEKCGTSLNPDDLISPRSVLSGNAPIKRITKHWFLPLDKYQPWLEEWLREGKKGKWKPNVYGQCTSWLKEGLHPRAMTRDLDWGVDVPLEGAEGKKLYVWMDAPLGYISATKDWAAAHGKDWEKYWKEQENPEDESTLIVFIGKDNIVFHCIIFPAILHAHGGYILPENVPANEFLNLEGKKISTSRDWAVWLHEFLTEFPGKEDVLRYMLTSIMPETKDSEFTWKDYQAKNNNELVAILGNFINRALVLTDKYYSGVVPARAELTDFDTETLNALAGYPERIGDMIGNYHFRDALAEMMNLARMGNKYLADTEPWKLIKTQPERVPTIMNISLQIAANLTILMRPFLPFSADNLGKMLNTDFYDWENAGDKDLLKEGHQLGKAELLFQKVEDEVMEKQMEKLRANVAEVPKEDNSVAADEASIPAIKDEITYDEFQKMDIRVATITHAEAVPKTDRLLKLTLDTGLDERTVVSGIAAYYEPTAIIGRQVCLLANLAPRKLRGILSHGMILMAEDTDGKLVFVSPSDAVQSGSGIS